MSCYAVLRSVQSGTQALSLLAILYVVVDGLCCTTGSGMCLYCGAQLFLGILLVVVWVGLYTICCMVSRWIWLFVGGS